MTTKRELILEGIERQEKRLGEVRRAMWHLGSKIPDVLISEHKQVEKNILILQKKLKNQKKN